MPAARPPDFLSERARAHPEKLAVVEERPGGAVTRWSFAELDAQVNRLAHALQALGARPGDRILWCGRNSPGVIRAIHAARKLGATAVPLSYRLSAREAAYVVNHSDAVACIIDAEHAALFAELRPQIPRARDLLVFDGPPGLGMRRVEELIAAAPAGEPEPPPGDHFAALMTYTSGTTGLPKGGPTTSTSPPARCITPDRGAGSP